MRTRVFVLILLAVLAALVGNLILSPPELAQAQLTAYEPSFDSSARASLGSPNDVQTQNAYSYVVNAAYTGSTVSPMIDVTGSDRVWITFVKSNVSGDASNPALSTIAGPSTTVTGGGAGSVMSVSSAVWPAGGLFCPQTIYAASTMAVNVDHGLSASQWETGQTREYPWKTYVPGTGAYGLYMVDTKGLGAIRIGHLKISDATVQVVIRKE